MWLKNERRTGKVHRTRERIVKPTEDEDDEDDEEEDTGIYESTEGITKHKITTQSDKKINKHQR